MNSLSWLSQSSCNGLSYPVLQMLQLLSSLHSCDWLLLKMSQCPKPLITAGRNNSLSSLFILSNDNPHSPSSYNYFHSSIRVPSSTPIQFYDLLACHILSHKMVHQLTWSLIWLYCCSQVDVVLGLIEHPDLYKSQCSPFYSLYLPN